MSTTDTPRTDAAICIRGNETCSVRFIPIDFARQLEREVAALRAELCGEALRLRAELAEAKTLLETSDDGRFAESQRQLGLALRHNEELRAELAAAREESRLWENKCHELIAPHYILDPDLRAQKFRDALAFHPVLNKQARAAIDAARAKEGKP